MSGPGSGVTRLGLAVGPDSQEPVPLACEAMSADSTHAAEPAPFAAAAPTSTPHASAAAPAAPEPPAAAPDFQALRACWHPVGFASGFADEPVRVVLLGEPIVIWRDSAGAPHALRDLCIHRGTALSLGRVVGDRLMCPYHGWQYGADGICALIPQLADPTRIPGKARVARIAVARRSA